MLIPSLWGAEFSGIVTFQSRLFSEEGLHEDQEDVDASVALQLEVFQDWDDGNQQLLFVPFLRADSVDEERRTC